ncbi:endolytic transglycosylase MltG [Candidatus Saccharibacteria bacterium]|nr:endolytic transglycosylase MltG [Candidatus Saccharibacteria bacterium]
MRIIGLDVGEKRIGVARVDSDTRIAVPVGFIEVNGAEWDEIEKLTDLNNTTFFVLGLPRSNEGNETAQSLYVRNFANTLVSKIPEAKIRFQDESLTSVEAEKRLKARKKRFEKGEIDAEAASIILQDFIENFKEPEIKPLEETNRIEKEVDKVKRNTKKVTNWVSGSAALIIIVLLAVGGVLWCKDYQAKKRAEYWAEQEALMEPEVFNFTILPGETIFQIKKNLAEVGYSNTEIEEAFNANYDYDFLKERPAGASLEGFLFGDTHEFYKSATVKEILETFLGAMGNVIEENNLKEKYSEQGLTLFEGVTLASIVQKEAPSPTYSPEQPKVAQVFLSRLAYGIRLGSDVTVSYALDTIDPDRETYSDNEAALGVDSCYNTRLYFGLPCGPISNPGLTALQAVANPSDTAYLYFLTGDDGVMYYSSTEEEHNLNAALHCSEFCNISL